MEPQRHFYLFMLIVFHFLRTVCSFPQSICWLGCLIFFFLLLFNFWGSLCILDTNALSSVQLLKNPPRSVGCLFSQCFPLLHSFSFQGSHLLMAEQLEPWQESTCLCRDLELSSRLFSPNSFGA